MTYLVKTYVYDESFIIEHQFMIFDMTVTHPCTPSPGWQYSPYQYTAP
jgi:hypothetical protein